jgi:hypothetical protein
MSLHSVATLEKNWLGRSRFFRHLFNASNKRLAPKLNDTAGNSVQ